MSHPIKILVVITFSIFMLGMGCSILGKKQTSLKISGKSREINSFSPYSLEEEYSFEEILKSEKELLEKEYRSEEIPKSEKELLDMLATGEVAISKAVYIENKKPVCFIDTVNERKLVPEFAYPALRPSSIVFKERFPACSASVKNYLASITPRFVAQGTQVAIAPIIGGMALVGGCFFGFAAVSDDSTKKTDGGLAGALIGWLAVDKLVDMKNMRPLQIIARSALGAGSGAIVGLMGYMVCENIVVYFIER